MASVFTTVLRVKDWPALHRLSDVTLIAFARAAGARRYQIYRNAHDAAEALVLVEGANIEALQLLRAVLMRHDNPDMVGAIAVGPADPAEGKLWEPTECSVIG
jgi:hypothetical protein